jgi:serine/threonine protein kinase
LPPTAKISPPDATGELPIPARSGSTDTHRPGAGNSDFVLNGSASRYKSPESDIAQFLAHPQGGAANTDDSPTVITGNQVNGPRAQPSAQPLPVIVTGEVPSIAGRRLGHFELIEAVGAGGMAAVLKARDTMAAVLKARDTELGRIVALKILPPDAARDSESVNRFKQEARAAAALDHENIARVYYCGEDQGLHFIAFEFVEGINLRQMIDRRGLLPSAECVRYMMQVAAGLNHAAERGVVHRDIKPSNIIITPDGRAKIVDMGLARHLGSELVNGGVTQSGVTLGTFDYISPEQALDPRRADVRSDIYSLGCTFYHTLTGRPPVPEGTAARKLRAHQYEQPLDPRELNQAISDELAAVLARMMAKDPTARYQSPMELIAHLKGLAERLNLGGDPLAYDNAAHAVPAETHLLPTAPRFHPMWVLAFAAVAVAIVAFVLATSNPGTAPTLAPNPGKAAEQLTGTGKDGPGPKLPNPGTNAVLDTPVTTAEELAARLEDPNAPKVITLAASEFDLTKLEKPVEFHGKSVELVGAVPGSPSSLVRIIVVASENREVAGSLTLKATEKVAARNIRFEMVLDPKVAAGDVDAFGVTKPVGVQIEDAAKVEFSDCIFVPTHDKLKNHDPRSVLIKRDGLCQISAQQCLFAPNADGLVVPPGATVNITDSGFGPHTAAVYIADGPELQTKINIDHCSFMLDPHGSVVEAGARVQVTATDCLFAPVSAGSTGTAEPATTRVRFSSSNANKNGVVIRTRGETLGGMTLLVPQGHLNGFYRVDPLGTPTRTLNFADCKKDEDAPDIKDAGHSELKQRPWADERPLDTIAMVENPWKAFKLKVEGPADVDPALFTQETIAGGGKRWVPLGAAFRIGDVRRAYTDPNLTVAWGSFSPKKTPELREKVWWPNAPMDENLPPHTSRSFVALLENARPGDVILIRHDGELPRDTIELKPQTKPSEGEFKVTFRAFPGSKPILSVNPDNQPDQTLFKLMGGEVTFEGIHFYLKPDQPKGRQRVAAVALLGGKSCTFKNCVFTLVEEDDSQVAAVHLPDIRSGMAMMTPAAKQAPRIVFENCLIRGKGRGVWTEVSRPLNLEMSDTLVAIDGPMILAEAGGKEASNGNSTAKLTRVTALAGGPIIEMRGGTTIDAMRPGGLVKLDVDTDACLFVAVEDAGRPLVDIDGVDPTDWKSVLNWHVAKGNRYANFEAASPLAVIKPGGDGMVKEWNRSQWINNIGEPPPEATKRFGEIKFAAPVSKRKDLPTVKPADIVPKSMDFADLTGTPALEVGVKPIELQENLKLLLSEMKLEP